MADDSQVLLEGSFPKVLDGAAGTLLRSLGAPGGRFPEEVNLTRPELVREVHKRYIEAGSEIIYTCTFGASELKTGVADISGVIEAAVENAHIAADGRVRVALDIGPLGALLQPLGPLSSDKAAEQFSHIARAGREADLAVIETMIDLAEALIALRSVKAETGLPVFVTLTFGKEGRTLMGNSPEEAAEALKEAGADAIGLNCSFGPDEALPVVERFLACTSLPVIVKPNAGLPDPKTNLYPLSPDEFAQKMFRFKEMGAAFLGGCCGTTPEHIAALSSALKGGALS